MNHSDRTNSITGAQHVLFWVCIFLYFVLTANADFYRSYWQIAEFNLMVIFTQIVTAYVTIRYLIPRFLDQKKNILFVLLLLVLMFSLFMVYNVFKTFYYDPKYFDTYNETAKMYAQESYITRISNVSVFISKIIKFLTPTGLLLLIQFYKDQRQLAQIKEQKRTAELLALKNQLNPHFLFNTLNNLYALALEKSDKTPQIIARLSEILDYTLYRCEERYVPIREEIKLIENYIALEKIRYGHRVQIHFKHQCPEESNIAPLILLCFIENAFKHGITQELHQGTITIDLSCSADQIHFNIHNTIPDHPKISNSNALGLNNVRKQLELLYPKKHSLEIKTSDNAFQVTLTLEKNHV